MLRNRNHLKMMKTQWPSILFNRFALIRKTKIHILIVVLVVLISGCRYQTPSDQLELTAVTDMLGREVMVPWTINKVVAVRAGALRLLVYMDATDKIAGIEEAELRAMTRPYLQAHPSLAELPVIGPSMGGDAELIVKTEPDVIFISYTTKEDADALQQKTGIPVIAIECPEFGTERDILYASFSLIGKVLHKEQRADSLIDYINSSIEELHTRTASIADKDKPSVYIGGVPYSGAHGINSTQPYFPPFMFTNARNMGADIDKKLVSHVKGTYIDKEQLLIWDPDFIFIDESGLSLAKEDMAKGTALFNNLSALHQGQVYVLLPYNNYAINYELVLLNAWYTGKILYPDRFLDVDIAGKADEILQHFLDKAFYQDIMEQSASFSQLTKDDF